jgi:hypothetical protein
MNPPDFGVGPSLGRQIAGIETILLTSMNPTLLRTTRGMPTGTGFHAPSRISPCASIGQPTTPWRICGK